MKNSVSKSPGGKNSATENDKQPTNRNGNQHKKAKGAAKPPSGANKAPVSTKPTSTQKPFPTSKTGELNLAELAL